MRIKNGNVFTAGSFQKMDLEFSRTITALGTLSGPGDLDAAGCYVIPGLVDIHTHGAVGEDFSDGKPSGLQPLADYYAASGVTSFLATTMTLKEETLTPAMHAIRDFRPNGGAKCAGIHLEGPFLSYAKRGAQAAENLHKPDAALLHRLDGASGGLVRLVTVAPEQPGSIEFIKAAKEMGILEYFLLNQGRLVTQQDIVDHVWDGDANPFSNSVRVHLSALRKKLKAALGADPIRTKIGEGYLLP